ncbi:MAG: glycosyltransferase family 2 protein [Gammaproteobacteria bacterium]|nr:glycosyltransferase family 2 protein [Gammaproteobacteria bacterium]
MISVLCASRKDSKHLAQFVSKFLTMTKGDVELLVMVNKHDTWNKAFIELTKDRVKYFYEDYGYGREGLHIYFNDLLKHARGDWILYMCEDHTFIKNGWDELVREFIKKRGLVPTKIEIVVPRFEGTGAVAHMVSRAFVDVAGRMGGYGNIDSWFGMLHANMSEGRFHPMDEAIFYDYTIDKDTPEKPIKTKLPGWDSSKVKSDLEHEYKKLNQAIKEGR